MAEPGKEIPPELSTSAVPVGSDGGKEEDGKVERPKRFEDITMSSKVRLPVRFEDISMAAFRVRSGVMRTPTVPASVDLAGRFQNVFLKLEHMQYTGSFKERGALNTLLTLPAAQQRRGVIAASAGNHALALAYHGRRLGVPVTVIMPTIAPQAKISRCRQLGAQVHLHGMNIADAKARAEQILAKSGQKYVNGYDDPTILAGAGTIGVEILEECPDVDAIVIPVGGAGLIAGVALAVKTLKPSCQVIGVEPEHCNSYTAALAAGRPVTTPTRPTLADGLAVPQVGANAFEIARRCVDSVITVGEHWISLAILRLIEKQRMVIEGGGAAGIAGLLSGQLDELVHKRVVTVLCGSNVDVTVLGRVIERGLFADGRLVQVDCPISDRPGGLVDFTTSVKELGGNIKDLTQDRAFISDVSICSVHCLIEVADRQANDALIDGLRKRGFAPDARGVPWGTLKSKELLHAGAVVAGARLGSTPSRL